MSRPYTIWVRLSLWAGTALSILIEGNGGRQSPWPNLDVQLLVPRLLAQRLGEAHLGIARRFRLRI